MSPLEASSVGSIGAILIALVYRRLTWQVLKNSVYETAYLSGFLGVLLMAVGCYTSIYQGIDVPKLALELASIMPGGGWATVILSQLILLGLGCILDDWAIILIFGPIFVFVIRALGFSGLWYGALFLINMQIAFLTPPYGFALFLTKAAVPKEYNITMLDIWRAAIPFVGVAVLSLIIVMIFPFLTNFLPNLIIGR